MAWRILQEIKVLETEKEARNFLKLASEGNISGIYAINEVGDFIDEPTGPVTVGRRTING